MNNNLIEEFVKYAPEEFVCLKAHDGGPDCWHLVGDVTHGPFIIYPDDDRASAEFIVFAWDWLEEQGQFVQMHRAICPELGFHEPSPVVRWGPRESREMKEGMILCHDQFGPTRTQALMNAIIAVQKAKDGRAATPRPTGQRGGSKDCCREDVLPQRGRGDKKDNARRRT